MNIKTMLLLFIFFSSTILYCQMHPAAVVLKSNDTLKEITGKLKSKSFKYKLNADGKSKEIEFSKIDYVVIAFSKRDIKTYNFFQAKDNDNFIAVNELLSENEIQLYGVFDNINTTNPDGLSINRTMVNYYIKKSHEEKLTNLGTYNDINNLKENILIYFDDCQKLISKIEQKEFKIKDGLMPMIKFYNETCSN